MYIYIYKYIYKKSTSLSHAQYVAGVLREREIFVYIYICVYICIYICICTHIYIYTKSQRCYRMRNISQVF